MDVYVYATFQHSQRGYVLMRLTGEGLRPVDAKEHTDTLSLARDFFFQDTFHMVWRDFCLSGRRSGLRLLPDLSMAGIRGMEGWISERQAVLSFAAAGEMEELGRLRRILMNFLGDYQFHTRKLFAALSVGEDGYLNADRELFLGSIMDKSGEEDYERIKAYRRGRLWERLTHLESSALTERELFRFAVCSTVWDEASAHFSPGWFWKKAPDGVISRKVYEELCLKR